MLAPFLQGVLGNACLACTWPSSDTILACLLGASLESPVLWGCLFAGYSLARFFSFRPSDRMRRPDVLSDSRLIISGGLMLLVLSLLSVGWGEEIFLILAMKIHHQSYLLFLNCRVFFDKNALCTSKKFVIVVIISQSENSEWSRLVYLGWLKEVGILLWICMILRWQEVPMWLA